MFTSIYYINAYSYSGWRTGRVFGMACIIYTYYLIRQSTYGLCCTAEALYYILVYAAVSSVMGERYSMILQDHINDDESDYNFKKDRLKLFVFIICPERVFIFDNFNIWFYSLYLISN